MFRIEKLINNVKKYESAIIQKEFESKKNTVSYVILNNKSVVLKWYAPGFKKNMKTEYSILKKCSSKIKVPIPYDLDEENNVITMNYIIGKNLCDVINDRIVSLDMKKSHIQSLAKWFASFHDLLKSEDGFQIRGDSILRNFILTNSIWGVDFEESRISRPQKDIATIISSILSTNPMFTKWKFQLCNAFIKSYKELIKLNLDGINEEISYALLEKIQFRPEKEEILRKYSKKIRYEGL